MRPSFRPLSLRSTVAAALLVAGLVPLAAALAVYLLFLEPRLQRDILREHEQLALEMGAVLDRGLFERQADIRAFVLNPAARDPDAWRTPGSGPLVDAMNGYVDIYDNYRLSMLVSPSGEVLAVNSRDAQGRPLDTAPLYAQSMAREPWLAATLAAPQPQVGPAEAVMGAPARAAYVARLYGDEGLVMPFAVPVRTPDGRAAAVWVNLYDFHRIGRIARQMLEQRSRIERSDRRIEILGPGGEVIFDTRPGSPEPAPKAVLDLLARRGPDGPATSGVIGGEAVAAASPPGQAGARGLGWTVITREDASDAFAGIRDIRNKVILLLALTAVVMLAAGAWWGRRISTPLIALAGRMRELTAGATAGPVPHVDRADDVGDLARAVAAFRQALIDKDAATAELARGKAAIEIERRRLSDVIEGLGDGFFALDRNWRMTLVNSMAERHTGLSRDRLLGAKFSDALPGAKGATLEGWLREVMERRVPANHEGQSVVHPDRVMQTRVFPTPEGVAAWFRDVTEERRSAAALRESEEMRALALQAAGLGAWDYNPVTGEVIWDDRCHALYGLNPDASVDYPLFLSLVHPADRDRVDAAVKRACEPAGNPRFTIEFRLAARTPSGDERWIAEEGRTRFEDGRAVRMRGIAVDITERKRAELHRELLVNELNHRVKNSLATVQAIAQQSLRADSDPAEARARFIARIIALARAHDVLTRRNWEDAELSELIAEALSPYRESAPARVRLAGPSVRLTPKAALAMSMAIHELADNAAKHGALSADGVLTVAWSTAEDRLHLVWREEGGPLVAPPTRKGLGSRLIEQGLAGELDAQVSLDYRPGGLVCTIDAPLPSISPG